MFPFNKWFAKTSTSSSQKYLKYIITVQHIKKRSKSIVKNIHHIPLVGRHIPLVARHLHYQIHPLRPL